MGSIIELIKNEPVRFAGYAFTAVVLVLQVLGVALGEDEKVALRDVIEGLFLLLFGVGAVETARASVTPTRKIEKTDPGSATLGR